MERGRHAQHLALTAMLVVCGCGPAVTAEEPASEWLPGRYDLAKRKFEYTGSISARVVVEPNGVARLEVLPGCDEDIIEMVALSWDPMARGSATLENVEGGTLHAVLPYTSLTVFENDCSPLPVELADERGEVVGEAEMYESTACASPPGPNGDSCGLLQCIFTEIRPWCDPPGG